MSFGGDDAPQDLSEIGSGAFAGDEQTVPVRQGWQTSLFDCKCEDGGCCVFCCTIWCPCAAFASIASIVDEGSEGRCVYGCCYVASAFICSAWVYAGWYRRKLRAKYGLPEAPLPDRLTHMCCHSCALAQEYRELGKLGFDVGKGWEGRPRPAATAAPNVQVPMARS